MPHQPSDRRDEPAADGTPPAREPALLTAGFDALPTQVAILDETATIVYTNRAWREFGERNDLRGGADTIGVDYLQVCRAADDDHARTAAEGIEAVLRGDRDEFAFEYPCHGPDEQRWFTMRAIRFVHAGATYVLVMHLDITDRKLSELRVAEQNDELETFNQVNALVQAVIDSLLEGVSRTEIETAVCERLAASHLYASAVVVTRDLAGGGVRVRASSGSGDPAAFEALGEDDLAACGLAAALDGDPRTVQHVHREPAVPDALQAYARDAGARAYAVVPLSYHGTVYGALVVNALRPDAFSERERSALAVLGETVGYASNAIENRRVLAADTLTEVELAVGGDPLLVRVAGETGTTLTLEGLVPAGDAVICYLQVDGGPVDAVVDLLGAADGVRQVRRVADHDGGGLVECTLVGDSPLVTLAGYGVTVVAATVTGSTERVTVLVSPGTDVRDVVETVQVAYPETDLVARRETERTPQTMAGFREQLRERLTDRQREVLEAAYVGGYFEQPRRSSGQELAASFDLSAPTFHQHLQAALDKLAALAFDDPNA